MKTTFFCSALSVAASALLLVATPAHAAYVLTLTQVGSEVVAVGIGSFNLTGLSGPGAVGSFDGIIPDEAFLTVGTPASGDLYHGALGPTSFGSRSVTGATTSTGNFTMIQGGPSEAIGVPEGYVSGTSLSSTTVFNNATFASLGFTPGTYKYTWGSGASADSLTITTAPEPSTWALLGVGVGLLGLSVRRRADKGSEHVKRMAQSNAGLEVARGS